MKRYKLAVFAKEISKKGRGVHRYQLGFIEKLNEFNFTNIDIDLFVNEESVDIINITNRNIKIIPIKLSNNLKWIFIDFPKILKENKYSLIHNLTELLPIKYNKKIKTIIVFSEFVEMRKIEFVKKKDFLRYILSKLIQYYSLKNADNIICLSYFNRRQILSRYCKYRNKVRTLLPGLTKNFEKTNIVINHKKNDYSLIMLSGMRDLNVKIIDYLYDNKIIYCIGIPSKSFRERYPKIKYYYNINDEDLIKLYKRAEIYVHLSDIEGLGYSILESLKLGTKVIAPYATAIRDILPKDYCYNDFNDFIDKYENILSIKKDRYFDNININAYRWQIEDYIRIYNELLN